MQIFALYFRVALREKPEWFDDFYKKYEGVNDLHVTIIQPRYIDEKRIDELKQRVSDFLRTHALGEEDKNLKFGELVCGPEEDGTYLCMLNAPLKSGLFAFQNGLKEALSSFENYVEEITREYEADFKPHITIARNVPEDKTEKMMSYFKEPYIIKGILTELVLPVVKNTSPEETKDPKNITIVDL